jgi:transcriptional regulator with XRE-family HTH domain
VQAGLAAMTFEVMASRWWCRQYGRMQLSITTPCHSDPAPGALLRQWRAQRGLSQLSLSLQVGVSQRHLSCIETGRAQASREMLHALMDALQTPLRLRNKLLLAAGFAPAYGHRSLQDQAMAPVRLALTQLLENHDPAPAFVLDEAWQLLQANRGTASLFRLLGFALPGDGQTINLPQLLMAPGGVARALVNADEVLAEVWQRAQNEALQSEALLAVVNSLRPSLPRRLASAAPAGRSNPLLLTHFRTPSGDELRFFSTFTTFGAPQDITAASLRVEHFFPADDSTRAQLRKAAA